MLSMKEIRELVDLVTERGLAGLEIERAGFRLRIDGPRPAGAEVVLLLTRPRAGVALMRDSMKIGYKPQWVAQTAIADLVAFISRARTRTRAPRHLRPCPGRPRHPPLPRRRRTRTST